MTIEESTLTWNCSFNFNLSVDLGDNGVLFYLQWYDEQRNVHFTFDLCTMYDHRVAHFCKKIFQRH